LKSWVYDMFGKFTIVNTTRKISMVEMRGFALKLKDFISSHKAEIVP